MARIKNELPGGARLADYLTVGYLAMNCPLDRVRAALTANAAQSKRHRGLPHEVLVYFVMAMCLYSNVAYEEVLRLVIEGLRGLLGDESLSRTTVTKGAISQARSQVGIAPLKALYQEQVRPIGPDDMAGVAYQGYRLMAIDGSTLYASEKDRRHRVNGTVVRVIEYALDGVPDAELSYRLITNWLDPLAAPAIELAALYHRRWTVEQSFDELKVHLADRQVILRSKRADLVEQEFYALLLTHAAIRRLLTHAAIRRLLTHAAIRRLMTQAADRTQQAAEDLSFVHAVRVLKRRLPACAAIPP
ncbi:MAG: transposase domain-containing protein [Sulfurimicrobium sp.]|nr:transposase domain-containing protein [Sulfurimicrobium sp.]